MLLADLETGPLQHDDPEWMEGSSRAVCALVSQHEGESSHEAHRFSSLLLRLHHQQAARPPVGRKAICQATPAGSVQSGTVARDHVYQQGIRLCLV
jgi:hypothetical protein